MNEIAIVYCHPLDDQKTFNPCAQEWADTRRRFDPGYPHDQHVVFCNGIPDQNILGFYNGMLFYDHIFNGGGWDIGTYQWASKQLAQYKLIVFMNARTYFWRAGWLKRLMEGIASDYDENGLYGLSASYEQCPVSLPTRHNPHIRTACFSTNPKTFNRYPYLIDSRDKGFLFESGEWNVSQWYADMGYKVLMVTWDGVYTKPDWRKPLNIFRRGDQTNLLVYDRHTKMFQHGSAQLRKNLSLSADNGAAPPTEPTARKQVYATIH